MDSLQMTFVATCNYCRVLCLLMNYVLLLYDQLSHTPEIRSLPIAQS